MCGCRKNANNNGRPLRSTTITRGVIKSNSTPTQVRALANQQPAVQNLNDSGLSAERRKNQAIRREAIRKTLNNRGR